MNILNLNQREQILSAIVITVLVLGSYVTFRAIPEKNIIESLQKAASSTKKKLLSTTIPDEPIENIDNLVEQLNDQEQAMALTKSHAEEVQKSLASFDSQELKVRISQLARDSNIRIKANETLKTRAQTNTKPKTNSSKSTGSINKIILPESSGWIARMSPGTLLHRPMQRVELAGSYQSLRQFIHGLEDLPWQVTVIKFQIEKIPSAAPTGYPQSLHSILVLAL